MRIDIWTCGDDCQCWYPRIFDQNGHCVWEGRWRNDWDEDVVDESREELKLACENYNIKMDLSGTSPWDWITRQGGPEKIELTGYLYIRTNEYDCWEVDEVCFDEDISQIFYKDMSHDLYNWEKGVRSPTYLYDILSEKLNIQSSAVSFDYEPRVEGEPYKPPTHTFYPDHKRVKITIEVLPNSEGGVL